MNSNMQHNSQVNGKINEQINEQITSRITPRFKEKLSAFLCGILILIIALITSTQAICFWTPGWWHDEYAKYNTPQNVNGEMSLTDAVYVTEQMLEYCIGRLDTLEHTEATIDGVKSPFFTQRELAHLSDCRKLFSAAINFRIIAALVILALLVSIHALLKGRIGDKLILRRSYFSLLAKGYLKALAVILVLAVVIVAIGMSDFTFLFTKFHHLFFDNDLWILDPRVDNLINIMQEAVFEDAAKTIALLWLELSALLAFISGIYLLRSPKN